MNNGETHYRLATIERRNVDEGNRTVRVAFSSEEPIQMSFGIEILSHKAGAVRLKRLGEGGPVLVEHDRRAQVGVVESVTLGGDGRARAALKISRSAAGEELLQDIVDGIRTKVSVGYIVHKFEVERGENGDPDIYRATDWEPFEISFVSIPADNSVGVNRALAHTKEALMADEDVNAAEAADAKPIDPAAIVTEERKRIADIDRIADEHDMVELARQYKAEGKAVADFQKAVLAEIGKRNNEIRAKGGADDVIGLSPKEMREYSFIRALRAVAAEHLPNVGNARRLREEAAFEREVSDAAAARLGINARGLMVPSEVQLAARADLSAGTATDGAELVATNLLAGSFIDVLRATAIVSQAGARMITGLVGNVDIPKKTSGSAATWVNGEDSDATQSDPQFGSVEMAPHDLAVFTQATRRLLQQSTPGIEALVRDDLVRGMQLGIDQAALYGAGVSGEPAGVGSTSGINVVTFAASDPTWAEIVEMEEAVETDNALMGALAYLMHPRGRASAKTTEKATNTAQFIIGSDGLINGYRALTSTQVTAGDAWFGNWSDLLIGMWGGLELSVDPYTHSLKGKIRYVAYQTVDFAVRHAVSFVRGNSGSTP